MCARAHTHTHNNSSLFRGVRQPLNDIFALADAENWHTRNLPYPPLQVAIVGGDNVDSVLEDPVDDAVIGICTLVIARQALPALIAGNT